MQTIKSTIKAELALSSGGPSGGGPSGGGPSAWKRRAPKRGGLADLLLYVYRRRCLYILLLPCFAYYLIFHYAPMYGVMIAFKDFNFAKGVLGSPWVGFDNFRYMLKLPEFYRVFANSLSLSLYRIAVGFPFPIILALLLNEIRQGHGLFKKAVQTVIYLPHFISWVIIGGILVNFLSPSYGVVNAVIKAAGGQPVFFLAKPELFSSIVVFSSIWKEAGWGTIIYLAALSGINPELYEAAIVDGADRFQRLLHVTLPGIKSTIVVLLVLRIGQIMGNGFEQIFVLQNTMNMSVSEVFETYTYRVGILSGRFSFSTTVGLFTSVIGMIMLFLADRTARLSGESGIF